MGERIRQNRIEAGLHPVRPCTAPVQVAADLRAARFRTAATSLRSDETGAVNAARGLAGKS